MGYLHSAHVTSSGADWRDAVMAFLLSSFSGWLVLALWSVQFFNLVRIPRSMSSPDLVHAHHWHRWLGLLSLLALFAHLALQVRANPSWLTLKFWTQAWVNSLESGLALPPAWIAMALLVALFVNTLLRRRLSRRYFGWQLWHGMLAAWMLVLASLHVIFTLIERQWLVMPSAIAGLDRLFGPMGFSITEFFSASALRADPLLYQGGWMLGIAALMLLVIALRWMAARLMSRQRWRLLRASRRAHTARLKLRLDQSVHRSSPHFQPGHYVWLRHPSWLQMWRAAVDTLI